MNYSLSRQHADSFPRGKEIIRFLASRPEFAGVGPATAQRLWKVFGEDLARILSDGDAEQLADVLPLTQAEIVCDAWRNQQAIVDVIVFFDEHGIGGQLARKAVDFWGEETVAKVRDNPYRLLIICTWKQVDQLARILGVAANDARRLVAAVEAVLYERLDEKHTATAREDVVQRVARLLAVSQTSAEKALVMAIEDGAAILSEFGCQPAGAAYAEAYIEGRLRAFLEAPVRQGELWEARPEMIEIALNDYNAHTTQPLTEEQMQAVRLVLANRFTILTGGAGVGKTTALKAIHQTAISFGLKVFQLALSGRAAKRMSDATGHPAQTIASWLGHATQGKLMTSARSLVVVDEASMLDLPTLYRLLFHLHHDARFLLVGDVAQLPPIGFGLTLHRLVESPSIPRVELTFIMRAKEATGIPSVSRAIREGQVPPLPTYQVDEQGCSLIQCQQDEIIGNIERIWNDLHGEEVQIVGATYAGPAGMDAINTHFHRFNAHGKQRLGRFAEGDPVIWLKNDYKRNLWNGSMGHVLAVKKDCLTVCLDGTVLELQRDEIRGRLDLAYAISTHKAQGSQWQSIIIPILKSRLLDRTLIYTAVTRAQMRVVLVGDLALLNQALRTPPASLARDVGLHI